MAVALLARAKGGFESCHSHNMMKLGDRKREMQARRMEIYAELQQADLSSMSALRFEYLYRRIHILTQKIKSFKGGLNNEEK